MFPKKLILGAITAGQTAGKQVDSPALLRQAQGEAQDPALRAVCCTVRWHIKRKRGLADRFSNIVSRFQAYILECCLLEFVHGAFGYGVKQSTDIPRVHCMSQLDLTYKALVLTE